MTHFPLAPPEELAKREAAQQRLDEQQKARETLIAEARADFARTQLARTGNYLLAAYQEGTPDAPAPDPALDPAVLAKWKAQIDGGVSPAMLNVAENYQGQADLVARSDADGLPSAVGNSADEARKYLSITQPERSVTVHPGPDEGVGIGWRAPVAATITIGGTIDDADATCGNGIVWSVLYREQGVERVLATSDLDNGGSAPINIVIPFPVLPGGQVLLNILPRDQHACDTTRVDLTITADDGQVWDFAPEVLSQFTTGNPWPDDKGNADVWWLYRGTAQTNLDAVLFAPWWTALREVRDGRRDIQALHEAAAAIQGAIDTALATEASPLAPALAKLSEAKAPYWIESPPAPEDSPLANVTTEIAALQAELSAPLDYAIGIEEGGVPTTEHEGLHDVRVHRRGEYTNLGDLVPRHMPALITGTEVRPVTQGSGRAELAQWLTDDSAPLLARVMVNRVWQHHFGEGLVRTPGDFGAQGQPPTHPELLDYLAARFIDSGWSIKALHRLILNTATWQQQSGADETRHNADPENRLLARMNRTRLDAESLRDSFFAVTDQLDTTPGGPAFADIATPRRTLYLKTVRSNLNTYTQLFDGADPTSIVAARNESTVAPQALFLMNDPLTLSTAEALAELAATDPTASAVDIMYRRLFNRPPTDAEHNIATETLQHLGHPENTNALAAYAQVLLSSNEFYFVD